jgi:hypothetical protein
MTIPAPDMTVRAAVAADDDPEAVRAFARR